MATVAKAVPPGPSVNEERANVPLRRGRGLVRVEVLDRSDHPDSGGVAAGHPAVCAGDAQAHLLMRSAITGEVVILRPVTLELAQAVVDDRLGDVAKAKGWPHADTIDAMRFVTDGGLEPGWVVLVDDTIVGECGTVGSVDSQGAVEIGYGLAPECRRQGLGTDAVRALATWLLSEGGALSVFAKVDSANVASCRLLERIGFRRESDEEGERRYVCDQLPT